MFTLWPSWLFLALGQHDGPSRLPLNRRDNPFQGPSLPQTDLDNVDQLQERAFLDAYDYDPVDEVPQPNFNSLRPVSRPRPAVGGGGPPKAHGKRPPTDSDCRSKSRTVPHEKYCDLYYHTTGCEDGQALLRSCPNGLLYTGNGRHGLIGVCDYPHNVHCGDKIKHSKSIIIYFFPPYIQLRHKLRKEWLSNRIRVKPKARLWLMSPIAIGIGNAFRMCLSCMTVQMVWCGWARTGALLMGVITHGEILVCV